MIERQCPNCFRFSKWIGSGACEHCGYCATIMDRVWPVLVGLVALVGLGAWIWSL